MDPVKLHNAVASIHAKGGLVKLAVGGQTYGNLGVTEGRIMNSLEQNQFVQRIVRVVEIYNFDGIDLTQVEVYYNHNYLIFCKGQLLHLT